MKNGLFTGKQVEKISKALNKYVIGMTKNWSPTKSQGLIDGSAGFLYALLLLKKKMKRIGVQEKKDSSYLLHVNRKIDREIIVIVQ